MNKGGLGCSCAEGVAATHETATPAFHQSTVAAKPCQLIREGSVNVSWVTAATYDDRFFEGQEQEATRSADVVIPHIIEFLGGVPTTVLDVGCGIGAWLSVWALAGSEILGVDGQYLDDSKILIPVDRFVSYDLTLPLNLGRRFDLVTCLEVLEHLDEQAGQRLVGSLTSHGEVIVFSAASPGQGGTHHVNNRWPSYWARIFANYGYRVIDPFRSLIWGDERISWWYRQNLLVATSRPELDPADTKSLDKAHPELVRYLMERVEHPGGRAAAAELVRVITRRLRELRSR